MVLSARRRAAASAVLLACAAVLLLSRVEKLDRDSRGEQCAAGSDYHIERGEALLHGIPRPGAAWAMPAYSVPNAVLCAHLPRPAAVGVRFAVLLAAAGAAFALGAFLFSPLSGAAAALLFCLAPPSSESGERWLYVLAVLLTAWMLVRRARKPSPARTAALGASLGAGFLMMSVLFLFPFLVTAWEWARGRARRRDAALLCALPFLFLVPWIVMNWRVSGRLIVFEDGRVDANIITGALGYVGTIGMADPRDLMGAAAGENIYVWAARELLARPLAYLGAVGRRALAAASLNPLLLLLSAGSLWLHRGREEVRQLALLAGYLVAIHCLMPVQANYFAPAWPLFAVLASGLLLPWDRPSSPRLTRACATGVHGVFALLLLALAPVLALAWAYPSRSSGSGALERELARHPRDPWLWDERGMASLLDGRPAEARAALARALSLGPSRDRELAHAWALAAAGGPPAAILRAPGPAAIRSLSGLRESVVRAAYLAGAGRRDEAAAALDAARSHGSTLPRIVLAVVSSWPPAKRPALLEFFAGVPGFEFAERNRFADAWLDMAATAGDSGQRRAALQMLAFAESLRLDPARTRKLAVAYRSHGEHARSLSVLKRAGPGGATDADLLLESASQALKDDRRAEALENLAFAEGLRLDDERLRGLALAYRDIGSYSRALAVLKRLDMKGTKGADLVMDMAAAAAKDARRPAALELLAYVEGLSLDARRARRLAILYRDLGACGRALAVMKRTTVARPEDVNLLLDLASAKTCSGERSAALASLAFAETLALDREMLHSLSFAYRDAGEYSRSLAVMKRAGLRDGADADILLDLSLRAAQNGRRGEALASLAAAEPLTSSPARLRRLAQGYHELGDARGAARLRRRLGGDEPFGEEEARRRVLQLQGEGRHDGALAIVESRLRARPGDARWLNDRGVLRSLMGAGEEAASDWKAAIARDPDFPAPYLSLGSLYASTGRADEARALYDRALSRRGASAAFLERIRAERAKLLQKDQPARGPRPPGDH
ncbi:MAG: hypothetical protein Q8T11_07705 [Elusimicrobiota bacterium]|nr:hypothetical protein [Elusimicrobiota bacterium]